MSEPSFDGINILSAAALLFSDGGLKRKLEDEKPPKQHATRRRSRNQLPHVIEREKESAKSYEDEAQDTAQFLSKLSTPSFSKTTPTVSRSSKKPPPIEQKPVVEKKGYRTGQKGNRIEVRYRPTSHVELPVSADNVVLYKGCRAGHHRYEYLTYVDTAVEKEVWLKEKKAEFKRLKALATLRQMRVSPNSFVAEDPEEESVVGDDSCTGDGDGSNGSGEGPCVVSSKKRTSRKGREITPTSTDAGSPPHEISASAPSECCFSPDSDDSPMAAFAAVAAAATPLPHFVLVTRDPTLGRFGFSVTETVSGRVVVDGVLGGGVGCVQALPRCGVQVGDHLLAVQELQQRQQEKQQQQPTAMTESASFVVVPEERKERIEAEMGPANEPRLARSASDAAYRDRVDEIDEERWTSITTAQSMWQTMTSSSREDATFAIKIARKETPHPSIKVPGFGTTTSSALKPCSFTPSPVSSSHASSGSTTSTTSTTRSRSRSSRSVSPDEDTSALSAGGAGGGLAGPPLRGLREKKLVSQYVGVYYYRGSLTGEHWEASTASKRRRGRHLGYFRTQEEAAHKYDEYAARFGLKVNFPTLPGQQQAVKATAPGTCVTHPHQQQQEQQQPQQQQQEALHVVAAAAVKAPPVTQQHTGLSPPEDEGLGGGEVAMAVDAGCQTSAWCQTGRADSKKRSSLLVKVRK